MALDEGGELEVEVRLPAVAPRDLGAIGDDVAEDLHEHDAKRENVDQGRSRRAISGLMKR